MVPCCYLNNPLVAQWIIHGRRELLIFDNCFDPIAGHSIFHVISTKRDKKFDPLIAHCAWYEVFPTPQWAPSVPPVHSEAMTMSGDTVIEPVKEQMDQVKLFFNNINIFLNIKNFSGERKYVRP